VTPHTYLKKEEGEDGICEKKKKTEKRGASYTRRKKKKSGNDDNAGHKDGEGGDDDFNGWYGGLPIIRNNQNIITSLLTHLFHYCRNILMSQCVLQ